MTVQPGSRLGPYEITAPLGAEGVYSSDGQWVAFLDLVAQGIVLTRTDTGVRVRAAGAGSQVRWRGDRFVINALPRAAAIPLERTSVTSLRYVVGTLSMGRRRSGTW